MLGHLDFTKTLLTQNPRLVVELDSHKRCPLHLASFEGHVEIVQEPLTIYEDACLSHDQKWENSSPLCSNERTSWSCEEADRCTTWFSSGCTCGNETVLHLCVKYNQLKAWTYWCNPWVTMGIFSISKRLMMATLSCI